MYWVDKKSYLRTKSVLTGKKPLDLLFAELKLFVEQEFGITVFDVVYEKNPVYLKPPKHGRAYDKPYRLIFHVASEKDREAMQKKVEVGALGKKTTKLVFDEQKQKRILLKFFELANICEFDLQAEMDETWVDYFCFFMMDYMSLLAHNVEKQTSKNVLKKYKKSAKIWKIYVVGTAIVVFYQTDIQKLANEQSGISKEIEQEFLASIKANDELKLCKEFPITFDSKENLDKNYEGDLFSYFK